MQLHRFSTATMAVVLIASLMMPFAFMQASGEPASSTLDFTYIPSVQDRTTLGAIEFTNPLNTSSPVPEYPLVSRALMLPGGSTDADVADVNGDGHPDVVVAVGGSVGYVSIRDCGHLHCAGICGDAR